MIKCIGDCCPTLNLWLKLTVTYANIKRGNSLDLETFTGVYMCMQLLMHLCVLNDGMQVTIMSSLCSLIKMLYWMCEKTNMPPTGPQLVHAIKRNFGGLQDENIDPEMKFREKLPNNIDESPDLMSIPPDVSLTDLF